MDDVWLLDPTTPRPNCPDCGGGMEFRAGTFGPFWGCVQYPACRGTIAAFPDGRLRATPGNAEVRELRRSCHLAFGQRWQTKAERRAQYAWLAEAMRLHPAAWHFRFFDADQCRQALTLLGEE